MTTAKRSKNDPLFPPQPKGKPTKSAKFKRKHLYDARRARIRAILDRTAKSRAEIDAGSSELDSAPSDPDSPDDIAIEYPPGVSLHDNADDSRVTIHIDVATYHRILYEAMKRRRTPNAVTDELVNEALDRVTDGVVENKAASEPAPAPVITPPPARFDANEFGVLPGRGPICDVQKGMRCRNPLHWRGRTRCGCSRPSRSAA